jgi:asparagine synthase (glutamine-hydrolysing)
MRTRDWPGPAPLSPVEIASGTVYGLEDVPPLDRSQEPSTPREAFEKVMVEALARPPCLISFSGGRDSSGLLALATHVARREGLPMPVPATLVVPGSEDANEDEWQEMVLRHLDIADRVCIEAVGDMLDAVGPVATELLQRHGLLLPFNTHFHWPIIEQAAGGTLVTGVGGDELGLLSAAATAEHFLSYWHRPRFGELLVVGLAVSPRWLRNRVYDRRARAELPAKSWLTPDGRRLASKAIAEQDSAVPLGWEAKVRRWLWPQRFFHACFASFSKLGNDADVRVVHPFAEPRVLDALARAGGFTGFGSRTELVQFLFGDLLPEALVSRRTKGFFDDALWTSTALSFARSWSGRGAPELVDVPALRDHWLHGDRYAQSILLLQQGWLTDHASGPPEPPDVPSASKADYFEG